MADSWPSSFSDAFYEEAKDEGHHRSAHDETLRFLESLTAVDASLEADLLDAEVDALLGRSPSSGIAETRQRALQPGPEDRDDDDVDFDRYEDVLEQAAQFDEEWTIEAARRVDASLLARETWDGGLQAVEQAIDVERILGRLFQLITEQQEDILSRRYGIGPHDPTPMTLDEIGLVCGVTRERIRQIEAKALAVMRESRELRSRRRAT